MTSQAYGIGGYGEGGYGSIPATLQPIEYYQQLITSQYQGCPQFLVWLGDALQMLSDIGTVIASIPMAYDLDYAVGKQLDVIGGNIGQSRTVGFQPSNGVSPVLDDATYRFLIKARIAQNHWTGKIDALQSFWQDVFPGGKIIIEDQQNMAATIVLSGAFTSIQKDLIQNGYIVPRPETVQYNFSFATLPILGFDLNTSLQAGFDIGKFS